MDGLPGGAVRDGMGDPAKLPAVITPHGRPGPPAEDGEEKMVFGVVSCMCRGDVCRIGWGSETQSTLRRRRDGWLLTGVRGSDY